MVILVTVLMLLWVDFESYVLRVEGFAELGGLFSYNFATKYIFGT